LPDSGRSGPGTWQTGGKEMNVQQARCYTGTGIQRGMMIFIIIIIILVVVVVVVVVQVVGRG